ncbi:MAG: hypothetical protein FJZ04_03875 [Candidatus Moranbacteria bacterium]|nr:hypothetical protein [Candidatus Moranbacteria bacterium]
MSLAKKMIVPRGILMGALIACAFVILIEFAGSELIKEFSVEKECTCTFKEYSKHNGRFSLKLNCGGKEGHSTDADLVSKYLKDPQSFPSVECVLYESGKVALKKK